MHRVKFVRWKVARPRRERVKIPTIKRGTREEQQATVTTMDKWYLLWRPTALLGRSSPAHDLRGVLEKEKERARVKRAAKRNTTKRKKRRGEGRGTTNPRLVRLYLKRPSKSVLGRVHEVHRHTNPACIHSQTCKRHVSGVGLCDCRSLQSPAARRSMHFLCESASDRFSYFREWPFSFSHADTRALK